MEIDLERCKELDALHNYKHSKNHVSAHNGFHAKCAKLFLLNKKIRNIAISTQASQVSVKHALINIGLADESILSCRIPWTQKEIDTIKQMLSEKASINLMDIKLDRNLNSVIGAINRIKKGKDFLKIKKIENSKNSHAKKKIPARMCLCGFVFIGINDQCNWCWGKNEAA